MTRTNPAKDRKQTGFHKLKSIFSALMVTTTTVVVAATVIPASAEGMINNLAAYEHEIAYSVDIRDSDNSIIDGSLKVVLENQSDEFEFPLELGVSTGIFYALDNDTQYTLRIVADKGYGSQTIASQEITTIANSGGSITGLSPDDIGGDLIDYDIGYFLSDPAGEFKSYQLCYATRDSSSGDFSDYDCLPLDSDLDWITIVGIPNANLEIRIVLEALNQADELVELDSLTFHTPFRIQGHFEIHSVLNDQVDFVVYPDLMNEAEINYEVRVIQTGNSKTVEIKSIDGIVSSIECYLVTFDNLHSQKDYTAVLIGKYNNPYTLDYVEEEIDRIDFTTTSELRPQVSYTEYADYYEVLISISDNRNAYIPFADYLISDPETGNWHYDGFILLEITETVSHGEYHFIVPKTDNPEYGIEIGLYSETTNNYMVFMTIPTNMEE